MSSEAAEQVKVQLIKPTSKKSPPKNDEFRRFVNKIGSFGLYQIIQFVLIAFLAIMPSMMAYSYVFVSATPRFVCFCCTKDPDDSNGVVRAQ